MCCYFKACWLNSVFSHWSLNAPALTWDIISVWDNYLAATPHMALLRNFSRNSHKYMFLNSMSVVELSGYQASFHIAVFVWRGWIWNYLLNFTNELQVTVTRPAASHRDYSPGSDTGGWGGTSRWRRTSWQLESYFRQNIPSTRARHTAQYTPINKLSLQSVAKA